MNSITLPVRELKPILTGLGKIIDKRLPATGFNCIRIERTQAGHLELMASNQDSFAVARLEAPSQGNPVAFLIPYEDLHNVAKSCGREDDLILTPSKEEGVVIKFPVGAQMLEHRCQRASLKEFPSFPELHSESIPINAALKDAIGIAFNCASVDPTRPILNTAFLDVSNPEGHYVVATDKRHLFSSNSFKLPLDSSLVIPNHRFLGWKEFVNDGDWSLHTGTVEGEESPRFEITSKRWRFSSRAPEGVYPNWRMVIPDAKDFRTTIDLNPASTSELIRIIARMPDHDPEFHAIGQEVAGGKCSLLGKSSQSEHWTPVGLPAAEVRGVDVRIFLNRNLLTKALRLGLARIEIIDPGAPLRFSNAGRQMIVMPVRQQKEDSAPPQRAAVTAPKPQPTPKSEPRSASNLKPTEIKQPMPQTDEPHKSATTAEPTAENSPKPALEAAFSQIETIKTGYRDAIRGLNDLSDLLKQAAREQRTSEKEFQSIRQTLRTLQSVRI